MDKWKSKLLLKIFEKESFKLDIEQNKMLKPFLKKLDQLLVEQDREAQQVLQTLEKLQLVMDIAPLTLSWVTKDLEYQGFDKALKSLSKDFKGQKLGFRSKDREFYKFAQDLFASGENILRREVESSVGEKRKYYTVVGAKYNQNHEAVIIGLETTRLKKMEEKLKDTEKLVEIDDLTGLYNMRSVYRRIEVELARGNRFNHATGVIMMDMDHFKDVNDLHDHLFGSYVLGEVGKILKRSMRNIDFGARFGGDEFLIVITQTTRKGLEIFCERIRQEIEKTSFQYEIDQIFRTVSIGYAITVPGANDVTAANLVRAADEALYMAKHAGRNCVRGVDQRTQASLFTGDMLNRHRRDF